MVLPTHSNTHKDNSYNLHTHSHIHPYRRQYLLHTYIPEGSGYKDLVFHIHIQKYSSCLTNVFLRRGLEQEVTQETNITYIGNPQLGSSLDAAGLCQGDLEVSDPGHLLPRSCHPDAYCFS